MTHMRNSSKIEAAFIRRAHGLSGRVQVQSLLEDLELLEAAPYLEDEKGVKWHLVWEGKNIASLKNEAGISPKDRDEAQALIGTKFYILREFFDDLPKDEFYHADLVGLTAFDAEGKKLGKVKLVHDYGAGVSLELSSGSLVPFTPACVPDVSISEGRVTIIPPAEIEVTGSLDGTVEVRE
ncbi:16S rRNA processing protein RimM [Acetobacteraceae bacterium]|nr:16S rRNA processing protein RimM [Acetobacteraceae bacterium]